MAYNAMINLPNSVIYGKETRTKDMEPFLASIEAAGKGGLQVVEYNFYAHRAIEGYYETVGRAKAGYTGFDHELELLVDENGVVVQPIYRDEKGQITPETLAAFPQRQEGEVQGPASAGQRRRAQAGGDVGQRHLVPETRGSRRREGRRAAGAASQRSSGADQPRVAADHGNAGRDGST